MSPFFIVYCTSVNTVFPVYKLFTCVCLHGIHTLSRLTFVRACLSVCVLEWVSVLQTHTHTHTHPFSNHFYLLRHTLCAKKSLHSLNLFIRSSNHFGISFSQQPLWYFFQSTTILVPLSLSLPWLHLFLIAQKYLENVGFFRYFWKEK